MAFVNEKLTPEQRKEFGERRIGDPRPYTYGIVSPIYWTIDYENDMCLVHVGNHREAPDDEYFVFINKDKLIIFTAELQFLAEHIEWKVSRSLYRVYDSSGEMGNVASALAVFQVDGYSDGRHEGIYTLVNVVFDGKYF